jgi:hypothetical protein
MSEYTLRRDRVIGQFALDHGVNELRANQLATEWEFEANRRGIEPRTAEFWRSGRVWMSERLAAERRAGDSG